MTARLVLATATMLLLGASLYLFLEVRAKPAEAQASLGKPAQAPEPEAAPETPAPDGEPQNATPRTSRVATRSEAARAPMSVRTATAKLDQPGEDVDPEKIDDAAIADPDGKPGYKLDQIMAEANRAYDRLELDEARAIAQRVLKKLPNNVRMLRIMVSAACHESDQAEAQKHYNLLPERDREQMKTRCMRNNVTFTDPPPRK